MKNFIKSILRKKGIQIKKYPDETLENRLKIIGNYKIDVLFDIGANAGQYATQMRELGYINKIVSFEPLSNAFQKLKIASSKDNNWQVNNYALGNENIKSLINIAGNSFSSSILNMLPTHVNSAPGSKYISQEEIDIKKVDAIFNNFCTNDNSVMLKIDTQGFEKNVIDGAIDSLKNIKMIQLEMSMIPLYEDEMLFFEMINYLDDLGFKLFSMETGFADPNTGQLLQVDGIFVQKNLL